MSKVKCHICSEYFQPTGRYGIAHHVEKTHNLKPKEYFDSINGKTYCKNCGTETVFESIGRGYRTFCSVKCSNAWTAKNREYKTIDHTKLFIRDIIPEYKNGKTKTYLRKKYHISNKDITKYFKALNVKERTCTENAIKRKHFVKHSDIPDGFIGDFELHMPMNDLAKKYSIPKSSIYRLMSRFGVVRSAEDSNYAMRINSKAKNRRIGAEWENIHKKHVQGMSIRELAHSTGISESVIGRRFNEQGLQVVRHKTSEQERVLISKLRELGIGLDYSNRKILRGKELDIVIKSKNVAVEYNGNYWHSVEAGKYKGYHTEKTEACLKLGIDLIHVWEHHNHKKSFSRLKTILVGASNVVGARECKVTYSGNFKKFFNDNHLDGNAGAKVYIGLEYKNELVCCISMRSNKEGFEIARFATKMDFRVVNGFSRLMKYVKLKAVELGYTNIITYADIDWTPNYANSVYFKYGMRYIGKTPERLFYTRANTVFSRQTFMKHKLKKLFPSTYRDNLTAKEILALNNVNTIYKTGNHKFILEI